MKRLIYAIGLMVLALVPITAEAAPPSPSPSLDQVIADPPVGYTELTSATIHGEFSAHDWASSADVSKQAAVEDTLNRDGFVDGFGRTWVNQSAQHVLVEAVMAFTGGRGAKNWLTALEVADKQETAYVHPDSITGIDTYYGVHLADSTGKMFGDEFSFVKGNDVFVVLVISTKDDALTQATSQATTQFQSAPDQTIPTSQWPENAAIDTSSAALRAGEVLGIVIIFVLILGVIAAVVGVVAARRRPALVPVTAPVAAVPTPTEPVVPTVQMSPDGNYWWDGESWREAAREAPPFAQRSSDGTFWWDGRTWRVLPQPPGDPQPPA